MSERENFKRAMDLFNEGNMQEAARILFILHKKVQNKDFRLQIIDVLLSALIPIKENDTLIKLTEEGISICGQMKRENHRAYLLTKKADFLTNSLSSLKYRQHNLRLVPGWFGFATEIEQNEYENIVENISNIEKKISTLIEEALAIVHRIRDRECEGYIWMLLGDINGKRYLHFKMDAMQGSGFEKAKWHRRFEILRRYGLENYLFYNCEQIKTLRNYISTFTKNFLKATEIFGELKDSKEAYAFYNLAVNLNTAFKFGQAKKYLSQAKVIAQRYRDGLLLSRIVGMEGIIKNRNKDIPNYLSGETRDFLSEEGKKK